MRSLRVFSVLLCAVVLATSWSVSARDFEKGPVWTYKRSEGLARLGFGQACDENGYPAGRLELADLNPADVTYFAINEGTGVFTIHGTSDYIIIKQYQMHGEDCASGVYRLTFADGTVWEKARLRGTSEGLKYLREVPAVKQFAVDVGWLKSADFAHLGSLLELTTLEITGKGDIDGLLAALPSPGKLTTLSLPDTQLSDAGAASLGKFSNLETLNVSRTDLSDEGLKQLAGLSNLKSLDIGGTLVTKEAADALAKERETLKVQWFAGTTLAYRQARAIIEKAGGTVQVDGANTRVYFDGQRLPNKDIDLAALKALGDLTPPVTGLTFFFINFSNEGFKAIVPLKEITSLEVMSHGEKSLDGGLAVLKAFAKLTTLRLDSKGITDTGLEHLKPLTELESLTLNCPNITDKCLEQFQGMKHLKLIQFAGSGCTQEGVAQLQKAMPEVKVWKNY